MVPLVAAKPDEPALPAAPPDPAGFESSEHATIPGRYPQRYPTFLMRGAEDSPGDRRSHKAISEGNVSGQRCEER